nr:hypothetical protein [uncultured bacterium]
MRSQMLRGTIAAVAIIGATQIASFGTAGAYFPSLVAETECLEDGSWKATYTASSDTTNYPDAQWEIYLPDGAYTPTGLLDSNQTATRMVTYPADQTAATEPISIYYYPIEGGQPVQREGGELITVTKPDCDPPGGGEWCSPGYWRQPHHLDSWPVSTDTLYNDVISSPSVKGNPTLLQVLQSPQTYKGRAFNAAGDYLSTQSADVDFDGARVEDSCPLN